MDWLDYREKLGISFCDREKYDYLLKRFVNTFEILAPRIGKAYFSFDEYMKFCNYIGEFIHTEFATDKKACYAYCIKQVMNHTHTITDFFAYFIAFVNSTTTQSKEYGWRRDELVTVYRTLLEEAHIPYDLFESDGEYYIYPKGAKELDNALVSQPLEWLSEYPTAHKTFCIALRQYSDGIYIRDVADNLRKALEEFLREFLENDCDLNRNKKEVEAYLKSEHVDPQLIQMFSSMITRYYLMNNEIAKHNDKTDARYLEFLLYQTGLFIRMLIVIKRSHQEVPTDAD